MRSLASDVKCFAGGDGGSSLFEVDTDDVSRSASGSAACDDPISSDDRRNQRSLGFATKDVDVPILFAG